MMFGLQWGTKRRVVSKKEMFYMLMTYEMDQLILGTMLGDGYMALGKNPTSNARLRVRHSVNQAELVVAKWVVLQELVSSIPRVVPNGGWGKELCEFQTRSLKELTPYFHLIYPNRVKTVSLEWLDRVGVLGLAWWYMDDGSLWQKSHTATISSHSFGRDGNAVLRDWLNAKFGVTCRVAEDYRGKGFFLLMDYKGRNRLFHLIEPFIVPSLAYKVAYTNPVLQCPVCESLFRKVRNMKVCSKQCEKIADREAERVGAHRRYLLRKSRGKLLQSTYMT
jgi:predicted nucleic acid-binding Zn ribbon protein